jgi:outer membrane protein
MENHMKSIAIATAFAAIFASSTASAEFYGKFGIGYTVPKTNNGTLAGLDANVDDAWALIGGVGYRFSPSMFIDFSTGINGADHTVKLDTLGVVATLDQRPVNLSFGYQFLTDQKFRPFVTAGYGWNLVSNEKTEGALAGLGINVDDGSGLALGLGADYSFNEKWFFRADVKWMDFDSDVNVESLGNVGTAKVNPIFYDLSIGYNF